MTGYWLALKRWVGKLKGDIFALYYAARDPGTPWQVKLFVATVVAYAFSPIDLIPDFIPLIGYLDDLILLPLGIALAIRWVPAQVMAACRLRAVQMLHEGRPVSWIAGTVVVMVWLALALGCGVWLYQTYSSSMFL